MGAGRQKRQKVLPLQICQVQAAEQGRQLGPLQPAHRDHMLLLLEVVQQLPAISMLHFDWAIGAGWL